MRTKWTLHLCQDDPEQHFVIAAFRPAWASEMTRRTPESPRSFKERRNRVQNVSSSLSPMSTPRTSRAPSAVIPVATTTARATTWPRASSRTLT